MLKLFQNRRGLFQFDSAWKASGTAGFRGTAWQHPWIDFWQKMGWAIHAG
jgi:hypothetical protein